MVHLYPRYEVKHKNNIKTTITRNCLSFLCLNAGIGFNKIADMGPRSIILTSGTLSPMESLVAELSVPFKVQLINKHVIDKSQVELQIIKRDQSGSEFQFSYAKRTD